MSGLPISVPERVGGRADLPSLQNVLCMAQRRTKVTRKLSGRDDQAKDRQGLLRDKIENMKENDERICHVIWH